MAKSTPEGTCEAGFGLSMSLIFFTGADKDEAINLYRLGINELEKGIQINCYGTGENYEKAQNTQEKMIVNLGMAKERLAFLGK